MVSGISASGVSMTDLLKQMRQKMFEQTDSNSDGSIDETELAAQLEKGQGAQGAGKQGPTAAQMLSDFDSDGDGAISSTEFDAGFKKLDEQMQSQMAEMQAQMQGMGQMPPPPPSGMGGYASTDEDEDSLSSTGTGTDLVSQLLAALDDDEDDTSSSSASNTSASSDSSSFTQTLLDAFKKSDYYSADADGEYEQRGRLQAFLSQSFKPVDMTA